MDGSTWSLGRLIRALAEIEGLERIRYTTSHPRDMDDELIAAHGEVPQLMPYLHLPVQSGSDRILEAMNRRHGRELFLRIVDRLRAARPDIALSADFIVGFPGESDADFDDTMRLVARGGLRLGLLLQVQPPARHAGRGDARPGAGGGEGGAAAALQALLGEQARAFNAAEGRPDRAGAVRRAGPQARPAGRQDAVAAVGLCRGQCAADRPHRRRRG